MPIKGMQKAWPLHSALLFRSSRRLHPEYAPSRCALFLAMSLLPSCAARVPGPLGSLCVLLALLLLTPPRPLASAAPSSVLMTELRCVCLSITPTVHPKMISNLEVIAAGPQCPKVELIATLKNGKEVCLDPEAPLVKKIFHKILSSGKQKN